MNDEISTTSIDCCIVGAGPAGAILGLLLARKGVDVYLLELHHDFNRDFRGDTIHPSVMEILDQIGLADELHQLHHSKLKQATVQTTDGERLSIDLSFLKTKFPYIMMIPQARFLEFITNEAKTYSNFHLIMGANVQELIEENGSVCGVRYRNAENQTHEVRATLTVGTDGRSSRVRRLAGYEPKKTSPPMDVLWFRLPRKSDEPSGLSGRIGRGHLMVMLDRETEWQVGYIIQKGGYQKIREAGLDELKKHIIELMPGFADRVDHLQDWKQVSFLSVESSRIEKWYKKGLLLIGDAAHVMSPVAGVGINYAIQDAVIAANVLTEPLLQNKLTENDLAKIQRKRELPTRFVQWFQAQVQNRIVAQALKGNSLKLPFFMRLPFLRTIPPRLVAFGLWRVYPED